MDIKNHLDNKLLLRQIKKHGDEGAITEAWLPLLKAINESYNFYEDDRKLIERSMEISSRELNEANEKLQEENRSNKATLDKLQLALKDSTAAKSLDFESLEIDELIDALIAARDTAENSSKVKEQFLSNMSHEIRTPMNGVIGMTNLLLQTNLSSEQLEYVNSIKFSSDNLLVIINDILDFNKIESGKIELDSTEFSVEDIINGVVRTIKFKADEKGLRVSKTMDADIPALVMGDPVRYNQIVLNLMGNAVKFTESGRIGVTVEIVEENDTHIILRTEISDTGIGIPEDKLETIFESFTQATSQTTREYGGTGLGLAISKELVELQEGSFEVDSTVGKGSTFSFILPFLKADLTTIKKQEARKTYDGKIPAGTRILLVEDNRINVEVAAKLLHKWNDGLTIDHAENGEMAIKYLTERDYDIVLMDLQMPVMDGYSAAKHIRNNMQQPKRDIPIIAISASAFRADQQKVFDCGMNDYVSKPFVPEKLFEKIVQYVTGGY